MSVACNNTPLNREASVQQTTNDTIRAEASPPNPSTQKADQSAILGQSIGMKIYEKGFSKVNKQDLIRFDISITNKSNQVVTAVKGRFVVNSIFGDHLKNYNLKFDDTNIKPGKTIKVTRFWAFDKTAKEDDKIRATPLSKLNITYEPEMVFFADGSSLQ